MTAFFKFVSNNVAIITGNLLPYRVHQGNHPEFMQQRLRNRFEHLVHDKRWQTVAPLMHFSPDSFFNRIYAELAFLAQKKDINEIDLLDLIFLSDEYSVIRSFITKHSIPCTQATLEKAILCDSVKGVKFLTQQGVSLIINNLDFAAANSRLACLRYLVESGVRPDNETLDRCVISSSHLPTLRYLVEECGIQPTESNIDSSIIGGQHLANRYLRERLNLNAQMNRNNTHILKG